MSQYFSGLTPAERALPWRLPRQQAGFPVVEADLVEVAISGEVFDAEASGCRPLKKGGEIRLRLGLRLRLRLRLVHP